MPVCPTGSELAPGNPTTIRVDPLFAGSVISPSMAWLRPYLPFMQPIVLQMDEFCALEPPADPGLDLSDLFNLIRPDNYNLAFIAGQKLAQLVHIFLWYRWCRCIDLSVPTPFDEPTAPSPLPVLNPPSYVSPSAGGSCRTDIVSIHNSGAGTDEYTPVNYTPPVGATSVRVTIVINAPGLDNVRTNVIYNSVGDHTVTGYYMRLSRAQHNGDYFNFEDGFSNTNSWVHTGALGTSFFVHTTDALSTTADSRPYDVTVTLEWFCGNTPDSGTPVTPCIACPPDPFLTAQLSLLTSAIAAMRDQVDLIQRQAVPFAFVEGTEHTALFDTGELDVSGLIGAIIEITASTPGTIGTELGDPTQLWGLGWINWGNDVAFAPRRRLTSSTTIDLPRSAGVYTKLAYSLAPGVIATITELVREP